MTHSSLDALAALLAAYDKAWDQLPSQAKLEDTLRSLRALGAWVLANRESLIEAARREAALVEALRELTAWAELGTRDARNRCLWCGYETQRPARPHSLTCSVGHARSLLHDSAGATARGNRTLSDGA